MKSNVWIEASKQPEDSNVSNRQNNISKHKMEQWQVDEHEIR